jgi:predicted helicase
MLFARHDDRFNATVNKIELNKKKPTQILVGKPEVEFQNGQAVLADPNQEKENKELARQLTLQFEQLQDIVFARMVQKVGDRRYWEQWAKSVSEIATRQVERINRLIRDEPKHQQAFDKFLKGLQKNINPSITQQEAVEMLSQHIITKPVFEALFDGYSFVKNNPVSTSMQTMLDLLESQAIEKDTEALQKFYESVKMRASGIDNAEGKQRIIIELYDKFFKTAFPKMVERLGIVYTPIEVVDFIIHSVNDVLKQEFGRSLSDENVNILDPFTGTGTFITRLLQSGLIEQKDLERKYRSEIFANEIVLLAYYIAAVNIENAFHDATPDPDDGIGKDKYIPFEGICLTDTFQLGESASADDLYSESFPQNSKRVQNQKKAPLRVILGNPPYSVGQRSANDNAQNQKYNKLDREIARTYAAATQATNKNSLYDTYIKAFRWSTDRLDKNGGVIAFVSNGSWIDGNAQDGFRKVLEDEFSSIWVFNLRGNQRTSGELSRKEGGKIFGSGSRTPISITLLVENPSANTEKATIHYRDIGDYLGREEKLRLIGNLKSIANPEMDWTKITPDAHGDWLSMRNDAFEGFLPLSPNEQLNIASKSFFVLNSPGSQSNRDSWVYNSSRTKLLANVEKTLAFYNTLVDRFISSSEAGSPTKIGDVIERDEKRIKWTPSLILNLERQNRAEFQPLSIRLGLYRPFFKQHLYLGDKLIHRPAKSEAYFPNGDTENRIICLSGVGDTKDFSTILSAVTPDVQLQSNGQCFALYYFEESRKINPTLFDRNGEPEYIRREGISDFILERARSQYGNNVGKEDIFYYVYGFLHSPEYRETFANDLKKMLPRLPLVDDLKDFWSFSRAGRKLADLHINYENVPPTKGELSRVPTVDTIAWKKCAFLLRGKKTRSSLTARSQYPTFQPKRTTTSSTENPPSNG